MTVLEGHAADVVEHGVPPPRIILVRPKASENVGAAARAMKNFGVVELVLVAPRCGRDARAYALASHAGDVLESAAEVGDLTEALSGCTFALATAGRDRSEEPSPTLTPNAGVAALPRDGRGAIVFGPEDHGLSNENLDLCQAVVRIPTASYASVNLAQAVNILCYAWHVGMRMDGRAAGTGAVGARDAEAGEPAMGESDVATRDQYERMYTQLRDTMLLIGYTDPKRLEAIMRMYRGFLDRARLDPREMAALRGMWSQVVWAAKRLPEELPGRRGTR